VKVTELQHISTRVTRFESLHEFFTFTDRTAEEATGYNECNRSEIRTTDRDDRDTWRYGETENKETYKERRLDPRYGKQLCATELQKKISSKEYRDLMTMALTYKKKMKLVDVGTRISVPHAIAGDDRYFIQMKSATKPTVKIGINVGGSCGVDANDLRKVAIGAVPIIYMLEAAGICTEVWGGCYVDSLYERDTVQHSVFEFPMKSAKQKFNWTTFAPMFQTGTFRHSFFKAFLFNEKETCGGLGCPAGESFIGKYAKENGFSCIIGINKPGTFDTIHEIFKTFKNN
jgi:hypothetical protein